VNAPVTITSLRPNSSGAYWRRVFFSIGGLVAATACSFFHHRCECGMLPPSPDKTTSDKTTQLEKKYCVKNSSSFTQNNIAYFRSQVAYYRQLFCSSFLAMCARTSPPYPAIKGFVGARRFRSCVNGRSLRQCRPPRAI
jgi:hypothetical protein